VTGPLLRAEDGSGTAPLSEPLLILFIKAPEQGRVKSRLAAVLGADMALELYKDFVLDTLGAIGQAALPFRIFFHPPEAEDVVTAWLGSGRRYLAQEGRDVGERMERAFRRVFARARERAILIGSDIPDLPSAILRDAALALERNDAVIGPALDGGYYLIGFRRDRFLPDVFRGVTWSGPDVFDRTMQVLRQNSRSVHILPFWRDVDTTRDLLDLFERHRNTAFASSRTMRLRESVVERLRTTEGPNAKV
jgi:rSAM/selenodomain-associated transferase 1